MMTSAVRQRSDLQANPSVLGRPHPCRERKDGTSRRLRTYFQSYTSSVRQPGRREAGNRWATRLRTSTLLSGWMAGCPSADVRGPSKTSQAYDCAARTDEEGEGKPQQSAGEMKGISLTMQQSYQEIGSEERDPQDDRADGESSPSLHGLRELLSMPKQHAKAC